ncbi:hypothetical protein L0F81_02765 [Streptomyces tricolor]|uniref:Uncharacterized protein n=1 Tax=Streptomyces tricolor TaxID=68277 RepID=A0ABS9J9J5_9ACTN|nr:hypothetical protein [Streptomyces tricolor]MCG0062218.1 hypothetical protein [Streptomyces tricolor]
MSCDRPETEDAPVQRISITFSALGVRVQADGRTGKEAWQSLRRQQPLLAWAALGYVVLLVVGVLSLLVVVQ